MSSFNCGPDLCDSGPCVNEGTCIDVPGGFTCQCPAGYDGPTCDSVARCLLTNDQSDVLIVVSVEQAVYLPGDLIEYGCPDGYHLSGSATRYCRSDFSWSGHEPECVMEDRASTAHCVLTLNSSDVLTIVAGQQAVYRPGDSVEYGCPDGYHLRGSATRICQADSKWSGQPAECLMTSLRSDGRAVPVVPIVSGIGVVIFFAVVLAIAITVFIRKRTASYGDELVNTPDVAYRTSKDLFMGGTYAEAKEATNEPIYQDSIL
ncbi:P-selectin-like [Patiria miniata]|uniref:Sushi, von Willebrand factor type A, EGF and pentraxin domain-containing protein 1-like n=1 Tax=Patiria miniata TaxID=46514 RepID=A0A914BGG8_PATMI|nr:P-selectin-like [Patiria miniata]